MRDSETQRRTRTGRNGEADRQEPTTGPIGGLAEGVFVGREQELDQLRIALGAALSGRTSVMLLFGEPGIGKTSLAMEVAADAQARGARVLWGQCYDWEGAPAYWPWVQIIRTHVHLSEAKRLRSDLGRGAAYVAHVVPELQDRFHDLPRLPRMDGNRARFQLFESIADFLRNATRHQPLVLVLEDLHWADTPSLLLLQFVAREIVDAPLLIIGTYRDVEVGRHHPLSAALAELARVHRTRRFALQGLSDADVSRLITLLAGIDPDTRLVDAVQRETGGNPLFVGEVVRLLVSENRLDRSSDRGSLRLRIPQTVREVIGRRLDRLSTACNEVLAVASVIGREFTVRTLTSVMDVSADSVVEALEEAVNARLITEDTAADRYRFTHALVQDTLYANVNAGRRVRLHTVVGEVLERQHAHAPAAYYGELAYHFGAAAAAGSADKAIEYAIKAGDHAIAEVAWETAIQHYQRALHMLDLQTQPRAELRCDVLLALGSAHYHTVLDISESPAGRSAFLQAAGLAKSIGAFERLARAALGFAGLNVVRSSGGLQQVELLEAALAMAPPEDGALKARLLARLAVDSRIVDARPDRRLELSDAALAMAKRLDDPVVLGHVLVARHSAVWSPDSLEARLLIAEEGRRAAVAAGDLYHTMWCQAFLTLGSHEAGDYDAVRRALASLVEAAAKSGIPYFNWMARSYQTAVTINEGASPEAETAILQEISDSQSLPWTYGRALFLFQLRREQGRLEEIDGLVRTVIDRTRDSIDPFDRHRGHIAECLLMIRHLDAGLADIARPRFDAFAGDSFADLPRDSYWLATVVLLADACIALGDRTRATLLYDLLSPYSDRNAAPGSFLNCFGAVSYYLGLLGTLLSRWDEATEYFEKALKMNTRMRARPAVARTQYAWAGMLMKRMPAGDCGQARELLDCSLDIARQLGMTRLAAQVEALGQKISTLPAASRSKTPAENLSPRELQVLVLIAAGQSDRQIGEKLLISQRTVTTHVTHIFNKLGLTNRAEAAVFAVRHGLA